MGLKNTVDMQPKGYDRLNSLELATPRSTQMKLSNQLLICLDINQMKMDFILSYNTTTLPSNGKYECCKYPPPRPRSLL
jgi:hypothetical protein